MLPFGAELAACLLTLTASLMSEKYEVIGVNNDGRTGSILAVRHENRAFYDTAQSNDKDPVEHYLGLIITTDELTFKIATSREYGQTKEKCILGGKGYPVFAKHKIVPGLR